MSIFDVVKPDITNLNPTLKVFYGSPSISWSKYEKLIMRQKVRFSGTTIKAVKVCDCE
jgi:hypothetical protein